MPVYCNYGSSSTPGYDDLGRLVSVNCSGTGSQQWQQNFSYDAFNNLTKTVPTGGTGTNWQPGYNSSNNQYLGGGTTCVGFTICYDANGNLLKDTFHTYTWNQDNHPVSMTDVGISMTYDAVGHLAELNNSGAYSQELLSPIGEIALMSGQTAGQFRMPLPGGTTAVTGTNANPLDFEHKDWLGSSPFVTSATTRAPLYSREFAPYGEIWNSSDQIHDVEFTGDHQDLVAGTYDTPNRELNANQGRWISSDPAHSGWNAYAYSTNPLGETDPSGLQSGGFAPFQIDGILSWPGGPQGNCTVDGQSVGCSMAKAFAQGGFGALCPTSDCKITDDGHGGIYIIPANATYNELNGCTNCIDIPASALNAANNTSKPCKTGFGFGVQGGGDAGAGVGVAGVEATAGAGAGLFFGGGNQPVSAGAFASGGATAYAGSHVAGTPAQTMGSPIALLGGFGAGGGAFITNASSASQLGGPFLTMGTTAAVGELGFSAQVSLGRDGSGNLIWQLNVSYSPGYGLNAYALTTKTRAAATGAQCQ